MSKEGCRISDTPLHLLALIITATLLQGTPNYLPPITKPLGTVQDSQGFQKPYDKCDSSDMKGPYEITFPLEYASTTPNSDN
jgi:hypothetical protein